jgi:hypothetical protein
MIDAAERLSDAKHLLLGKRERFFSYMSDENLLGLVDEATRQCARDEEIDRVIRVFEKREQIHQAKGLYVKALLMSGRLSKAVAMAEKEEIVGWSYGSSAGVVFGSVLSAHAGHSEKACTIRSLLKGYADKVSVYSMRISIADTTGTSFFDEIIRGLKQRKHMESEATESFAWAEKIGKSRIDHIVSNKHRAAYQRAAQVLGSLAEVYVARGQENKADRILHTYYSEKYKRFSAFRKEVKAVVKSSELLRNAGFLN